MPALRHVCRAGGSDSALGTALLSLKADLGNPPALADWAAGDVGNSCNWEGESGFQFVFKSESKSYFKNKSVCKFKSESVFDPTHGQPGRGSAEAKAKQAEQAGLEAGAAAGLEHSEDGGTTP